MLFFGTLHSNGYIFHSLLCFLLLFFSQLFVRPPQTAIWHFFFLGMVLITVSCKMSQTSIRGSSGTLSDLITGIYLSFPLYSPKGFDLGHTWMSMATSCEELTHWKRIWCWEGLGAGGEGDDRGWDGWMASRTRWIESQWTPGVGDGCNTAHLNQPQKKRYTKATRLL